MKFGEEWRQMNQLKKFLSCLISLRLPNNNTNQIQSSLPNGKIDFDLICCGLGRRERNLKFFEFQWSEGNKAGSSANLSFGWVMAAASGRQPAKREDERAAPTPSTLLANSTTLLFLAGHGKPKKSKSWLACGLIDGLALWLSLWVVGYGRWHRQ